MSNIRKLVLLDAATIGDDVSFSVFAELGELTVWQTTSPEEVTAHIGEAEVVFLNKVKLNAENLAGAPNVRLICIAATGFDNIDLAYCRQRGIAVSNVVGYSTQSVAQVAVSMALSLMTHLHEYTQYVRDGSYSSSGIANKLTPAYHEIYGKTWGIVGYGNIGAQVGRVAEALGCRVLAYKRTPVDGVECVDFDTICRESDILSIHTPLNDGTRGLLDREHIAMLKPTAIVVNVARGAVTDEAALADAILEHRIGGLGVDVYSVEPFPATHPFVKLLERPNVCLTPHMAWGGFETRTRLLLEMAENVRAFTRGELRNRVDVG